MTAKKHYFIGGIGGSGMLPLAVILKGMGHDVSGSDRSRDQGRTPEKFQWIEAQGIALHPQDGSGITRSVDALVISKAVEDTVPDVAMAKALGVPLLKRVDMLVQLFNDAKTKIAIAGTSGKTTTTGMAGFILKEAGLDPTINNGGIFRNYARGNPYSTAFVGKGNVFVSEIDESDGIEAVCAFTPDIAVLHNVTLDHQPMHELRAMFSGFLARTRTAIINTQDPIVLELAKDFKGEIVTYGSKDADLSATKIEHYADGVGAEISFRGAQYRLRLKVPGEHNISNALAALLAANAAGVEMGRAVEILGRFEGIRRRMEVVGTKSGITVMDDFAHNPDKIAATVAALKEFPGRLHIFFQPHGFGFLKLLGAELAQTFADSLLPSDRLYLVEPLYLGGTVEKTITSEDVARMIRAHGGYAAVLKDRTDVRTAILGEVKAGDRIIVMGARDDTLSEFAKELLGLIA